MIICAWRARTALVTKRRGRDGSSGRYISDLGGIDTVVGYCIRIGCREIRVELFLKEGKEVVLC
jgi:hypothetical protein